jgi:hypothetical protein
MSRIRLTSALAATALGATALVAPMGAADAAPKHPGHRSLATVLAADGNHFDRNWSDFDIVDRAVHRVLKAKPGSAVGVLADGRERLTAFVPTDRAFRALVTDVTGQRPATERATWRKLVGLVGIDTVESVLLYHVAPGATITYRQALHADGARLQTALPGGTVRVNVTPHHQVRLQDADRNDRNPRVLRAAKNVNLGNLQIAHGINRVLRPIDL